MIFFYEHKIRIIQRVEGKIICLDINNVYMIISRKLSI